MTAVSDSRTTAKPPSPLDGGLRLLPFTDIRTEPLHAPYLWLATGSLPTPAQVFRMATSGGAATTPFADTIGALEAGRAASMVLIDWREISYPYLDPKTPLIDAVL